MPNIFSRTGSTLTVGGTTAKIPDDVSALSILTNNAYVPEGEYNNDGYVYVNGKPVKKWFKNIDNVRVWFPILEDVKQLQRRYNAVKAVYLRYLKEVNTPAFDAVKKVKKAHAKVTHKFSGNFDPWWLYTYEKYEGHPGISFDWVSTPKKPLNLKVGNKYYQSSQRLEQLGGRSWKFKTVLMQAISSKLYKIQGYYGELLKVKILDSAYWYQHGKYTWELITGDDNPKTLEL